MARASEGWSATDAEELEAILAPYARVKGEKRYRRAPWLLTDFDATTWTVLYMYKFDLDWRVPLYDGTILTDHPALWESLRTWLVAMTHVDLSGGRLYASRTVRNLLSKVLHFFDYLLLHAKELRLLELGLSGLSQNDFRALVAAIASNRSVQVSAYDYPRRLSAYLRRQIEGLPENAIEIALGRHHDLLTDIPGESDRLTDLDENEVVLARAWFALEKRFKAPKNDYRRVPALAGIIEELFAGTLVGRLQTWVTPIELCLGPDYCVRTERTRARVHSPRNELMNARVLTKYIRALAPLRLLHMEGLEVPVIDIDDLQNFATSLPTKPAGRFRTLPQAAVFSAFRRAVDYVIDYGQDLVTSYVSLAIAAQKKQMTVQRFSEAHSVLPHLTEGCRGLGVERWTIEPRTPWSTRSSVLRLSNEEYFRALRRNPGLWESLRVLYGAIQIVVGLLSARRAGELVDLHAESCLDPRGTHVLFRNRKSGIGDLRELEARPIPPLCTRFIELIKSLQAGLIESGLLSAMTSLFAPPAFNGTDLRKLSLQAYSQNMDLFCDWAETDLDTAGNRYYFRQHQLRRFFAMLFFWGGGFGGMDTLRWFLGQTDVKHLWHYITESTPGIAVRSVAAEWCVYQLKNATEEARLLSVEVEEHFGTSDFDVLEEEALQAYLEDLMEQGALVVEPQFIDGGRHHRIAVVLRKTAHP